jgi:hypothetical protein
MHSARCDGETIEPRRGLFRVRIGVASGAGSPGDPSNNPTCSSDLGDADLARRLRFRRLHPTHVPLCQFAQALRLNAVTSKATIGQWDYSGRRCHIPAFVR